MRSAQILNVLSPKGWRRLAGAAFVIVVLGILPIWTVNEQSLTIQITEPIEDRCGGTPVDVSSVRRMAVDTNNSALPTDGWRNGMWVRTGKSGVWRLHTAVVSDLTLGPVRWNKRYCIVSADGPLPR